MAPSAHDPAHKGHLLNTGQSLHPGDYLRSPSGQYQLILQPDGNLVVYADGLAQWDYRGDTLRNNPDDDRHGYQLLLQPDGNLVLYTQLSQQPADALWNTHSAQAGRPAQLELHDDGRLVLRADALVLWSLSADRRRWQAALPDGCRFNELSVPGTHDAGTFRMSGFSSSYTKCQSRSIGEQLADGIRVLDIRCCYLGGNFDIYHAGYSADLTFDEVLNDCTAFLLAHPTEAVVLVIKQENSTADDATFNGRLAAYFAAVSRQGFLYTGPSGLSATLGELRGKIQVLRRVGGTGIGTEISWGDNITRGSRLWVQDMYDVSTRDAAKKAAIHELLDDARANAADDRLYFNFISMAGVFSTPEGIAEGLNEYIATHLPTEKTRLGVLLMDFPTRRAVDRIIRTNF